MGRAEIACAPSILAHLQRGKANRTADRQPRVNRFTASWGAIPRFSKRETKTPPVKPFNAKADWVSAN